MHLTRGHYARSWGYRILEVRGTTGCSPISHLVTNRRLRLFGHIARSSSRKDHHRALAAAIRQDYRPTGSDLATLGSVQLRQTLALWTLAWRKVTTRDECRHIVNTGTLQWSTLWKKERRKERIAVTPIYLQSMRKHGLCTCYSEIAHLKHHIIRTGILLVAATIEYQRL